MTISDGLTQISNKRFLMDHLDKEFSRAKRYGRQLSIIMFDLDRFKDINDQYGHLTGDYVLKEMAHILKNRIRKEEVFARYGGEEFVVVLPESDNEVAVQFGEILRAMVEENEFEFEGQPINVGISVGVGTLQEKMSSVSDLVKEADEHLYEAKRSGRNKVVG